MTGTVNPTARVGSKVRWLSVVAGMGVVAAGVLPGFLSASLAPRIARDFAFGESALGLAIGLFYLVCAVLSWLAGGWVERLGTMRALRLGGASSAASCFGVALFAQSAVALTALIIVGGLGNALAGPAVSSLLRRDVPEERHGMALGLQQAGAPAGTLIAGLSLPAVAIPFGWRWAFVLAAVLSLVSAAAAAGRGGDGAPIGPRRPRAAGARTGAKPVRIVALSAALASFASIGLIAFLVIYAVRSGMSEGQAGLLLGAASVLSMLSRAGSGALADRPRTDPLVIVAAVLLLAAAATLLLLLATPLAVSVAALVALGVGWGWGGPMTLAVIRASPDSPAWAVGVMMAGLFGGAVAGPLVLGVLADRGEFGVAWLICSACALLAAIAALAARRHR